MTPIRIQRLRKRLDMTQVQFGNLLGVNHMTVSRWERGRVAPEGATAQLLCAMDQQIRRRQVSSDDRGSVLKAIAAGAAVGGLVILLAALFGRKA